MISEELKQQIFELRKEGKSIPEICKIVDLSKASVSKWCKIIDPKGKHSLTKKLTEEDKEEIVRIYQLEKNLEKVSKIFTKVTKRAIRDVLIKKEFYIKRKNITKRDKSLHVINWKKRKKIELVEYKGGKCEFCGYNKCVNALEFHHKNPKEKDFSISSNSLSFEKMKKEVDKCLLLCANCHGEEHERLRNNALEA